MNYRKPFFIAFVALLSWSTDSISPAAFAEAAPGAVPLRDMNGDGKVEVLAFGDSITYGVGDGIKPGEYVEEITSSDNPGGYPRRLKNLLGVPVRNAGVPGEELVASGVYRVASVVTNSSADVVVLLEGSNDAVHVVSRGDYSRALQKAINVARADGKQVVLITVPRPSDMHASLTPFTEAYAEAVRELATINDLPVADMQRAWSNACADPFQCQLYNLPEGLHPNTLGYDHMAQTVAATLLNIDIFAPGGAAQLEQALDLPAGSVVVKPDPSAP
jgi:lysophospholipase L1-like esterase